MTREDLKELVTKVVDDHRDYQAAIKRERAAEAALLKEVLEMVAPAAPALCNGPYLRLGKGTARGWVLLLRDGSLAVQYGPGCPVTTMTPEYLVDEGWDVPDIVESLVDALERQANGRKEKRTDDIEERASRLRAVTQLVRRGK